MMERYKEVKSIIKKRIDEFKKMMEKDDIEIFAELTFCLLTPQSKAKKCWEAVERLKEKGLLIKGVPQRIEKELNGVRFHRTKARYICEARNLFVKNHRLRIKQIISRFSSTFELRDYLVKNVRGMGYKEASHFLRNIGLGDNIAILDRHILRAMKDVGMIKEVQKTLTKTQYTEIEKKFLSFARKQRISPAELDLYLWFLKTGEVFK